MLFVVCIPRDIECGDLFANNHLILKMIWTLKVMTGACKTIINCILMNFDMSWAFLRRITLALELKVPYSS
jgi:hypothetical protein